MKRITNRMICMMLSVLAALAVFAGSFQVAKADNYQLDLYLLSDYAYVYDIAHDAVLLDKNSSERMYPASLTKMMTEIIALEHYTDMDRMIEITYPMIAGLKEAEASRIAYQVGDKASVRDLLYGVMLPSAADSCHALAITLDGSLSAFADRMNRKAKEIGMKDTHFVNSSGLHDDDHYSTCRDIATLMQYCIQNEQFLQIIQTYKYVTLPTTYDPEGCEIFNGVLRGFERRGYPAPGLVGGKTGFTDEALQCLAVYAEINDMKLIVVTAHGNGTSYNPAHFYDVSNILTELEKWHYAKALETGEELKKIVIHHEYSDEETVIRSERGISQVLPDEHVIRLETGFADEYDSQLDDVEVTETVTLYCNDKVIDQWEQKVTIPKENSFFGRIVKFFRKLFSKNK